MSLLDCIWSLWMSTISLGNTQPRCQIYMELSQGCLAVLHAYVLFLLHPVREQGDTFTLISVRGGDAFLLNSTPEIRILLWSTSMMPFEPPL